MIILVVVLYWGILELAGCTEYLAPLNTDIVRALETSKGCTMEIEIEN